MNERRMTKDAIARLEALAADFPDDSKSRAMSVAIKDALSAMHMRLEVLEREIGPSESMIDPTDGGPSRVR